MSISSKISTLFRGDVPFVDLPREVLRRRKAANRQKQERRYIENLHKTPARLTEQFAAYSPENLLEHFRSRNVSFFLTKELEQIAKLHWKYFPAETTQLIGNADVIVKESRWELAGLGSLEFKDDNFWRRDPITGKDWGLDYHADVTTYQDDGADIRILWELNRFGHGITLACAYAVTGDEIYAETFFTHIESWMQQNPYGRGANWNCAMEVALRAINLLAAFDIFHRSNALNVETLRSILKLFDQHGRFILDNNEFSYISTSNHYLSDVIGLFWIGTLMPELERSAGWQEFGLREMLREMDKQILPDGADFEASTGYHKFVTELFLYSFILAERNDVKIAQDSLEKLRDMLQYLRGIMRPDGSMPLIGDADGSQIIPIVKHDADDAGYLLLIGSAFFDHDSLAPSEPDPEILWLFGETNIVDLKNTDVSDRSSIGFPDAGSYVMRDRDLYMHFNANDCGLNGRGSHGHNDALSIEISAFGRPFIIDPGSYVYNLDREARHLFRSTAYHSTVMVDDEEQNTTIREFPFVMGNEASPTVTEWSTSAERDRVSGEHYGYKRLTQPIAHRRSIEFDKRARRWTIEDELSGIGHHKFSFAFHLASGINVQAIDRTTISLVDHEGNELFVRTVNIETQFEIIPALASRNYGRQEPSSILKWEIEATAPFSTRFIISTSNTKQ